MAGDESVMATVENEFNVITSRVTCSFGGCFVLLWAGDRINLSPGDGLVLAEFTLKMLIVLCRIQERLNVTGKASL